MDSINPQESICFRAHEQMLGAVLEKVRLPDVARSGWPILRLLGHVARVVRRANGEGWDNREALRVILG